MSPTIGLPPPPAPGCLETSRESRYLGGTLVAEDVRTLAEHQERLACPDLYRPEACLRCGTNRLHVHSRPERHPRGDPSMPAVVLVLQFCCALKSCGATWRVLPLFLARHLWHTWKVVEQVVMPSASAPAPVLPPKPRTRQRWHQRFASSARELVVRLAMSGSLVLEKLATQIGLLGTRGELALAFAENANVKAVVGERLSRLGALIHRLERGIRLM